jgi:hypothetical protein
VATFGQNAPGGGLLHSTVQPVVHEADANRATFEAFCRSLAPDELATVIPSMTWRVQDYIAHLASIDIYVAQWFEHTADGLRWHPAMEDGAPFDINAWNEARIVERREAPVEDLIAEAATNRDRLWAAVDRFSSDVLESRFNFRGTDITMLRYLQLWVAHDPAHTADMLRGLPSRRDDPELAVWLAKYRIPMPAEAP